MRKSRLIVSLGAVLLAVTPGCGDDTATIDAAQPDAAHIDAPGEAQRLVILYTTDEHSHLFAIGPEIDDFPPATTPGTGSLRGGLARRKTLLDAERAAAAAEGIDTLTVSAGDVTQGALPQVAFATTSPDFVAMKKLGYDVITLGNHELDLGPAGLAASIAAAQANGGFPQAVMSNIFFDDSDPADDSLAALYGEGESDQPIKRYHVVTTPGGIKVGFVGIMGVEGSYQAPGKPPVHFSGTPEQDGDPDVVLPQLYADIQPVVDALRDTEQVDVVVALSHTGFYTATLDTSEEILVAEHIEGIDVIISGHSHEDAPDPIVRTAPDGHQVPILQTLNYGKRLGRVELVLEPGQRPAMDAAKTRQIEVDDTVLASTDAELTAFLDSLVASLEAPDTGPSFLEAALTRVTGAAVADDPATVGDLYHFELGGIDFDIDGHSRYQELNTLNLSTDAMLALAEELVGPTDIAIQGAGVMRADVLQGVSGRLGFADVYRMLPLGMNPHTGTLGYPLVRFNTLVLMVKGALEFTASVGMHTEAIFFVPAGLRVEFDTSRPAFDPGNPLDPTKGRVTKIVIDTDHSDGWEVPDTVVFDASLPDPWAMDPFASVSVVTDYYVATFATTAGVTMTDASGAPLALEDAVMTWPDGSDVKDYIALMKYVYEICAANGGMLPARYDSATAEGALPRRMICSGPECP